MLTFITSDFDHLVILKKVVKANPLQSSFGSSVLPTYNRKYFQSVPKLHWIPSPSSFLYVKRGRKYERGDKSKKWLAALKKKITYNPTPICNKHESVHPSNLSL